MKSIPSEVSGVRKLKSDQLRVRLREDERRALEERCVLDRQAGHIYAETLSSWLRHHIQLIIGCETRMVCSLSSECYRDLLRLAKEMDQSPEKMMEACISGIAEMLDSSGKEPLIVAELRLRRSYRGAMVK